MSPRTLFISAAVAAGLTVGAGAAQATGPVAHDARSCGYSRKLGTTYVNDITARRVGCAKAKAVIKAFNACRHRNGLSGHCSKKVAGGFRCSENRLDSSPIQYDSRTSCRRGGKRVKFLYTQNT